MIHNRHCFIPLTTLTVLAMTILFITSCTYNPFVNNNHLTGNAAGPLIGGAAGGVGAAALGAPRPLIVATGLAGAGLGYYMTTLRFDAGPIIKSGGDVYAQGAYVGISIPSYKLFEPNTANLLPQAEPLLDSVVTILKRYPNSNIQISGNTSGFGSRTAEQKLSEARAKRISSYLWAHGINNFKEQNITTRKLSFIGYGNYFPTGNDTKMENVQKNSRIQITAYPSKGDLLNKQNLTFTNVGGYYDSPLQK